MESEATNRFETEILVDLTLIRLGYLSIVSFFCCGVQFDDLPYPSYPKKKLSNTNIIIIQLLNNLFKFKVC